jgi:hypothetical protein
VNLGDFIMGEFTGGENYGGNLRDATRKEDTAFNFNSVLKLINSSDIKEKVAFNKDNISQVEEFFNAPYENRVTLLQSVRGAAKDLPEYVQNYLVRAKEEGKKVYVPMLHTEQADSSGGIQICNVMRLVIEQSSTVAVAYNPDSEGTKFDFGIKMYHDKHLKLLNPSLKELLDDKGSTKDDLYEYMMVKSGKTADTRNMINAMNGWVKTFKEAHFLMKEPLELELSYISRGEDKPPALSPQSALFFGMVYASKLPFTIISLSEVKKQVALEDKLNYTKSYSRVALKLHDFYEREKGKDAGTIRD